LDYGNLSIVNVGAIFDRPPKAPPLGELSAKLTERVKTPSPSLAIARATSPVAVPGIFVAFEKASSSADRCHSLSSLFPPPAALASLPLWERLPSGDLIARRWLTFVVCWNIIVGNFSSNRR